MSVKLKGLIPLFFMCGMMELPSLYTAWAAEEKKAARSLFPAGQLPDPLL
jgi:hypothetical protein